jgi:hypothetical protein
MGSRIGKLLPKGFKQRFRADRLVVVTGIKQIL